MSGPEDGLRDLYQELILDHGRRPRNFSAMPDASAKAEGFNPLCGDKVTVFLRMEGDRVGDVSFQGSGCAISTSSASLMTERLKGMTRCEATALAECFHAMVTSDAAVPLPEGLGKLEVLGGVREYPMRIKCATLAWHTLKSALLQGGGTVSTE